MSGDRAVDWLEANPVADDAFTTDRQEAIDRGIYYKPVCECGCGKESNYTLGSRGTKSVYVNSWECRTRVRQQGKTRNTKMTSFVGVRFVKIDKRTGDIVQ